MPRPASPSTFSARSSITSSQYPLNSPSSSSSPPKSSSTPLKVTLLGPASCGKTALRRRGVKGDFLKSYHATIGVDFQIKSIVFKEEGGSGENDIDGEEERLREVELQLWDTAGQERFKSISTPFFRGSLGCILTFDYTTRPISQTIDQLRMWFLEFREKCDVVKETKEFCWVVVGCKSDLVGKRDRKEIEKKVREEVKGWFREKEGEGGRVKGMDFEGKKLEIGPSSSLKIPNKRPSTRPTNSSSPTDTNGTLTPTPTRPGLSKTSTSSTITSIELSSSLPTDLALNPKSLLLMSTSPPHPPSSVEPLGHPAAIYEGGPFSIEGRLLESDKERPELGGAKSENKDAEGEEEDGDEGAEAEDTEEDEPEEAYEAFKMFRTSAKTGEGVEEVFEYCAKRILRNLSLEAATTDGSPRVKGGVIRINERETGLSTGQKLKRACCT
ncbi:hypothetical protein JCM16303_006342 [Sporobolomyces ruberrimus]